jgi:hypothetical protein
MMDVMLLVARDQSVDIPTQLSLGVRLLQAQAHMYTFLTILEPICLTVVDRHDDGSIHFCHTSCILFDGGTVQDYLKKVKVFLDANPNEGLYLLIMQLARSLTHEVITFVFTNPEGLSMNNIWLPAFKGSGIDTYAYVPPSLPVQQSAWPTLGEMIASGKRVVTFMDAGANKAGDTVDFILPEFPNVRLYFMF